MGPTNVCGILEDYPCLKRNFRGLKFKLFYFTSLPSEVNLRFWKSLLRNSRLIFEPSCAIVSSSLEGVTAKVK